MTRDMAAEWLTAKDGQGVEEEEEEEDMGNCEGEVE